MAHLKQCLTLCYILFRALSSKANSLRCVFWSSSRWSLCINWKSFWTTAFHDLHFFGSSQQLQVKWSKKKYEEMEFDDEKRKRNFAANQTRWPALLISSLSHSFSHIRSVPLSLMNIQSLSLSSTFNLPLSLSNTFSLSHTNYLSLSMCCFICMHIGQMTNETQLLFCNMYLGRHSI